MAYFDPLGYSVLTPKERTTTEREIKALLKDVDTDTNNVTNDFDMSHITTQTTSSSSSSLPSQNNQQQNKSIFTSFLNSVSINKTSKPSIQLNSHNTSSIADELMLYKSLASKEFQKIIDSGSNPDASKFW